MKTVLVTLAIIAASLSLISVATTDVTGTGQAAPEADPAIERRAGEPPPATQPMTGANASDSTPSGLPSELGRLRAALDSNREELQWVQDLLQQAGETLYWAQTRHQQSAMIQQRLEDQLIAITAAYEARQIQVAQLAGELQTVKASLAANSQQGSDTQAHIQALENEREQLRHALASRDQQLAAMEKELQTARAELKQAKAPATEQPTSSNTCSESQNCRAQQVALNRQLKELRHSETEARHSLVDANTARYRLQKELAACNENLYQAKASDGAGDKVSFASMEAAAEQSSSTPTGPDSTEQTGKAAETDRHSDAQSGKDSPVSLQGVKFRYDSYDLTAESRAILDRVAAVLRKQKHLVHEVAGHTDSQGDPAYNLRLSQKRAETVRNYLIARGVDARSLQARGYGGLHPIADNSTWAGLVSNRRVELRGVPAADRKL